MIDCLRVEFLSRRYFGLGKVKYSREVLGLRVDVRGWYMILVDFFFFFSLCIFFSKAWDLERLIDVSNLGN